MLNIMLVLDMLGTIAFAISGALVGIRHRMDWFGVNVLAIVTATGGGILRDIIIGDHPPVMFRNPIYVLVAAITANVVFVVMYFHPRRPKRLSAVYDMLMFVFDTLGVAAFTVDGVMLGVAHGYKHNLFLLVFLGVMTGVGGGMIRDVLADQMPDVLRKHVYAIASILGAVVTGFIVRQFDMRRTGIIAGFCVVVLLRVLASHFKWNLPKVRLPEE